MAKHLTRDLEALQRELLSMASLVEEAIYQATQALLTRDPKLAREVIAGDAAIDAKENEVEEDCLKILALHQPAASDLRRVAAVFSITTDLERMGDLAVAIAERALALTGSESTSPRGAELIAYPEKLKRMTDLVAGLVRQALDAFVNLDSRQAMRVIRLDNEVDRYHAEIIADLIAKMKADPAAVEPGLSLFSATRHLERIGDHATNIAEDVVYLVDGEIVRHRPEAAALDNAS